MRFGIESEETERGTSITVKPLSGRFGKAPALGYSVKLIESSFIELLEVFEPEYRAGFINMVAIKALDGSLEFDPKKRVVEVVSN